MDNTERKLTKDEAARVARRSTRQIHRWMMSGRLDFERDPVSGRVTITESALRAALLEPSPSWQDRPEGFVRQQQDG